MGPMIARINTKTQTEIRQQQKRKCSNFRPLTEYHVWVAMANTHIPLETSPTWTSHPWIKHAVVGARMLFCLIQWKLRRKAIDC
jgi:hypothetical protein